MSMHGNKKKIRIFISSVYYLKCWNILFLPVFYQKPKNNWRTCRDCDQNREHGELLPFSVHPGIHTCKS